MTGPGDRSGEDAAQGATAPGGGFRKGAFGVTGSGDTSGFGGLVRVEPGGAVALHTTDRPYGGYFDEVTDALVEALGPATYDAAVQRVLVDRGEITYFVAREHLLTTVRALRDDEALRFELCSSDSGVDYLDSGGPAATPDRQRSIIMDRGERWRAPRVEAHHVPKHRVGGGRAQQFALPDVQAGC